MDSTYSTKHFPSSPHSTQLNSNLKIASNDLKSGRSIHTTPQISAPEFQLLLNKIASSREIFLACL